eukprot:scaffold14638_cov87-Cyclotella_meneghiniana.AAC.1
MKSASAVDTDAIDNIATNGSLVDHFGISSATIYSIYYHYLIHHCLTPGTSAVYLPDTSSWNVLLLSSILTSMAAFSRS